MIRRSYHGPALNVVSHPLGGKSFSAPGVRTRTCRHPLAAQIREAWKDSSRTATISGANETGQIGPSDLTPPHRGGDVSVCAQRGAAAASEGTGFQVHARKAYVIRDHDVVECARSDERSL